MQRRPAQVGVDDQHALTALRKDGRQVEHGGGLAFARPRADDRHRVELLVLAREQEVRAQDTVGFGVWTFGAFVEQNAHVLRDDSQHRRSQRPLDIVDRLHARIEILDEEGQPDADHQTHDDSQRDIHSFVGCEGPHSRHRPLQNFDHGCLGQVQLRFLCCHFVIDDQAQTLDLLQPSLGLKIRPALSGFLDILRLRLFHLVLQVSQAFLKRTHFGVETGNESLDTLLYFDLQVIDLGDDLHDLRV